jgi:fimbrial isopeptide formation D2 family protein/LPXTG-motif cell wall-anchored protein
LINKYTPPQPIKYEKTKAERHQKEKMRYIMKNFKRILSFAIVAIMMLSALSIAAFAATITVTNLDPGTDINNDPEVYTAYKIFDAVPVDVGDDVVTNPNPPYGQTTDSPISYRIENDSSWFPVLFENDGTPKTNQIWFVATAIPGETAIYQVNATSSMTGEPDARAAAAWLLANKPTGETGINLIVGEDNDVDDGYYLVTSSLGSNLGLATANIPMVIVEKNTFPAIDKKQNDDGSTTYADTAVDVAVGDKIYYQLTVTVPATFDKDITITDILPAGLKAPTTVASDIGTLGTDYTVSVTGQTVAIVIKKETTDTGLRGKTVNFTYSADVEVGILLLTDENKKNAVSLVYSNFTQNDAVSFNTYDAGAYKYAGDINANPTSLAGAQFELQLDNTVVNVSYDETNKYYYPDTAGTAVITSDAEGKIVIRGLDNKTTYSLKETVAPGGYNLPTDPFVLVLEKDSSGEASITPGTAATINIQNVAGTILPSTGGIGTTIFYIVGSVLVVGAGVVLITKKRMSAK